MSYTLVLEWMPGDLYMSAVTARCTAPTSSYSVVWLPPNKVYQITLYCGSTSLVSFLVGAFRGKAWSYMSILSRGALSYLYHVDLIPYNVTDKTARKFIASNNETIKNFSDILHSNRISVATRMQFGSDIGAGCGQLYADERD